MNLLFIEVLLVYRNKIVMSKNWDKIKLFKNTIISYLSN